MQGKSDGESRYEIFLPAISIQVKVQATHLSVVATKTGLRNEFRFYSNSGPRKLVGHSM